MLSILDYWPEKSVLDGGPRGETHFSRDPFTTCLVFSSCSFLGQLFCDRGSSLMSFYTASSPTIWASKRLQYYKKLKENKSTSLTPSSKEIDAVSCRMRLTASIAGVIWRHVRCTDDMYRCTDGRTPFSFPGCTTTGLSPLQPSLASHLKLAPKPCWRHPNAGDLQVGTEHILRSCRLNQPLSFGAEAAQDLPAGIASSLQQAVRVLHTVYVRYTYTYVCSIQWGSIPSYIWNLFQVRLERTQPSSHSACSAELQCWLLILSICFHSDTTVANFIFSSLLEKGFPI